MHWGDYWVRAWAVFIKWRWNLWCWLMDSNCIFGPSCLCALSRTKCPLLSMFQLFFLSVPVTFLLEGVIVGFWNLGFFLTKKCLESPDMANKSIRNFSDFFSSPWHVCRKISAGVDGGLSGGSIVRRPGSEDPHQRQRKFSSPFH